MTKDAVKTLLQKALSQNLTVITGSAAEVKVAEVSFEDFRSGSGKLRGGRTLSVYANSNRPLIYLLVPEAAQKKFLRKFADIHNEVKEETLITKLVLALAGKIPKLCGILPDGEDRNVLTISKAFSAEQLDQIYWDASECVIFTCTLQEAKFYVNIRLEFRNSINRFWKTDKGYSDRVKEKVLSTYTAKDAHAGAAEENAGDEPVWQDPIRISIKNPLEFLLGSCFLPRQAYVGKKNISTSITELIATKNVKAFYNDGFLWYRFWIEADGVVYTLYYTVDVKGQTAKYKTFFERLFTELVKSSAVFLRDQVGFSRAGGKIVDPPAADKLEGAIIFNAALNLETRELGSRLFVPPEFLSGYLARLLHPWEIEFLKKNIFTTVLSVLSVNATLFGNNIDTFYRLAGTRGAETAASGLRVSELLSILDLDDARRLVQNYFLASGWSLQDFQSLFMYQFYADDVPEPLTARDALFDKKEYRKFIPKALQDDWEKCYGISGSFEDLLVLNEKALREIFTVLEADRLVMPYKAEYMLKNEFRKPLDDRFRSKINRLLEENPWPGFFEQIPKKSGQQEISAVPTGKLAAALAAGQPEVKTLAPYISKTKRQELEEELIIQKKKYEQEALSPETVFNAMNDFLSVLERLAIPEDEMVE